MNRPWDPILGIPGVGVLDPKVPFNRGGGGASYSLLDLGGGGGGGDEVFLHAKFQTRASHSLGTYTGNTDPHTFTFIIQISIATLL